MAQPKCYSLHEILFMLYFSTSFLLLAAANVNLTVEEKQVTLDNGICKFTFSNPEGQITQIEYDGFDSLLKPDYNPNRRAYWDLNWLANSTLQLLSIWGTEFEVIDNTTSRVEISFKRPWDHTMTNTLPMNYDIRYIMEEDKAGVYAMVAFSKPFTSPPGVLIGNRFTMRLNQDRFSEMWQSDTKHRLMPSQTEVMDGITLQYKEAVQILKGTFKGEVADKYQYSLDTKDSDVYGWASPQNQIGLWYVFPSHEFQNGGPTKQQLTIQSGPINLAVFSGGHLMKDNGCEFRNGEAWEKIYGPFLIYLNQGSKTESLWSDAKAQVAKEKQLWPYKFVKYPTYANVTKRAIVSGKIQVLEGGKTSPAKYAHIGLAAPGPIGSWQTESKYYQFWTTTDAQGNFQISNVVPGFYNVYAWVPGVLGNFMHSKTLAISQGQDVSLGTLVFEAPRDGPTLWEIGIPDRSAAEFFVPDPPFQYSNPLFVNQERWRQYGIWESYSTVYKSRDLIYQVGKSDYKKDWFYAHLSRKADNGSYLPTTWTVKFPMKGVQENKVYFLRIGIAASNIANLEIRFNKMTEEKPDIIFSLRGDDNAIARHGIHGTYDIREIAVPGSLFVVGDNYMYLTQSIAGVFTGFMYDYLRLESPL